MDYGEEAVAIISPGKVIGEPSFSIIRMIAGRMNARELIGEAIFPD